MTRVRSIALLLLATAAIAPSTLNAACTSPAGIEGEQIYNTDYATMQFCDNTNWISMAASGSITAELDPKVGTLTPAQINAAMQKYIDPSKISIFKAGDFAKANEAQPKP